MLPPTPLNIILFELDFDVKFPLLRLLQCLIDLKSTIPKVIKFEIIFLFVCLSTQFKDYFH